MAMELGSWKQKSPPLLPPVQTRACCARSVAVGEVGVPNLSLAQHQARYAGRAVVRRAVRARRGLLPTRPGVRAALDSDNVCVCTQDAFEMHLQPVREKSRRGRHVRAELHQKTIQLDLSKNSQAPVAEGKASLAGQSSLFVTRAR